MDLLDTLNRQLISFVGVGDNLEQASFRLVLLEIAHASIKDTNPYITIAKFIFADSLPNENHEGIKEDEFDNIIKTAPSMPVLVKLTKTGVGQHSGATPIGSIRSLEKKTLKDRVQLIGEAVLWEDKYPKEVDYIEKSFDGGQDFHMSWEVAYKNTVIENGITWIKSASTVAVAFVGSASYGYRTPLLGLDVSTRKAPKRCSCGAYDDGEMEDKHCPICGKHGEDSNHTIKKSARRHRDHWHSQSEDEEDSFASSEGSYIIKELMKNLKEGERNGKG